MHTLQIYREDLQTAQSILNRDEAVTRAFFYRECYPLFFSLYNHYETDCQSCLEFINEIYLHIMTPSEKTGHCQLQNFRGESSLKTWLKVTALYYCYEKFAHHSRRLIVNILDCQQEEGSEDVFDRLAEESQSIEIDGNSINRSDVNELLELMPNSRYRELIRLRYIEQWTNEETAQKLGMSMDNYYNSHKRAKEQFVAVVRKEEYNG